MMMKYSLFWIIQRKKEKNLHICISFLVFPSQNLLFLFTFLTKIYTNNLKKKMPPSISYIIGFFWKYQKVCKFQHSKSKRKGAKNSYNGQKNKKKKHSKGSNVIRWKLADEFGNTKSWLNYKFSPWNFMYVLDQNYII